MHPLTFNNFPIQDMDQKATKLCEDKGEDENHSNLEEGIHMQLTGSPLDVGGAKDVPSLDHGEKSSPFDGTYILEKAYDIRLASNLLWNKFT